MSTADEAEKTREEVQEAEPLNKSELDSIEFTWFNGFLTVLSLIFYATDVISDGVLAVNYHSTGHYLYFGLTLTFVLVPAIAMSFFTVLEYRNQINYSARYNYPSPPKLYWAFRKFCLVLCISPLAWYMETIYYGYRYSKANRQEKEGRTDSLSEEKAKEWKRQKERYAVFLYVHNRSTALLRLIEAFSECAPQMMLQLYIMAEGTFQYQSDPWTVGRQYFSIVTSTCSLAWAVVSSRSFTQMLEVNSTKTEEPTLLVKGILFLGHLLGISARSLAIGMFASTFGWIIWLVILTQLLVTFALAQFLTPELNFRQVEFKNRTRKFLSWERHLFLFLISTVFVFSYMHNNRRLRMRYYYAVRFVENTVMTVLWFLLRSASERDGHPHWILIGHYFIFFVGIAVLASVLEFEIRLNQFGSSASQRLKDCLSLFNCCENSETLNNSRRE